MKQKLLYILMIITALLGGNGEAWAWGENPSYVLNESAEVEIMTGGSQSNPKTYTLNGLGEKLTFQYKGVWSTSGYVTMTAKDANGNSLKTENYSPSSSWQDASVDLPPGTVSITFGTGWKNALNYERKYIQKVLVTRATTLSAPSTVDIGEAKISETVSKNVNVDYNNTTYPQELTGSCSNPAFTVTSRSIGETSTKEGPAPVTINFKPPTIGTHSGTVTLSMAGKTVTFTVTGTALATYNFSAQASPNNANYGSASASVDKAITSANASETATATFSATANPGYEFVGWGTTADATTYESTANPYQTSISNSAHATTVTKTLYAIFRPVFKFSVAAEKIYDYGTVSATVTDKILGEPTATSLSTQATFIATPKNGATFEGWYNDREHTQLVSKDATYTPTIINNAVGSTQNLTLYAWFKCNQTISWADDIQDFNLIQGTTVDCSATSDKGLNVSYKSSNPDVASVDENGIVTGNEPSNNQVVITAYQEGNDEFNSAPELTRSFYVLQKLQPVFEVSGFTGNTPTLKVGETATITLSNVDGDFTFSSSDNTVVSITRNGNVLTLAALKVGTAKVVLSQPANNTHNAASAEYNTTVVRHQGGLAVSLPETMKVGEALKDFWNTNNNEVPVTVESSNPNVLSYADGTLSAVGEGTAVITVSQAETDKWAGESRQQTITVSKVANTLGISLASLETKVGNGIAVSLLNQNNTETPVIATITEQELSSEVNDGTDVISYANGVITAKNAGKAKITFSQSASAKYEAFASSTYEITVTKLQNPISLTLNGGSALSINLKYGATASLAYSSVHSETPITVSRTSGSHTTLSGNTITAGNAAGTDIYEVKQPETHKYEEGYAMFTVRVNNTNEELGYVLYDETQYSHGTGAGIVGDPDKIFELSGPGEILYYSATTDTWAIYYNLFVEYSTDQSEWHQAQNNQNLDDDYNFKDFSCPIPETARYVRFRFPSGGTLTKYIKNVKVPRKTYVRASSDKTDFGTVYTGSSVQATFTVDYSTTNGGNIHVNSSNPNFTVSSEELAVSAHSDGTKTFKVTYTPNPNQLGEESALITVSDLFYTQEITLKAVAAKQDNTLNVVGEQNLKVGDVVDNVYSGKNSDAELTASLSRDGVVSYDATSNRLTAVGEGSVIVTISQNANDHYHGVSKTIAVNVSKNSNTLVMSVDKTNLKVGETATVNFDGKNSDGVVTATYSVDGIVEYHNGEIVALKAGNTRITLTQAATVAHTSVSQSFDIAVTKHDQTVQWDNDLSDNDLELNVGQTLETNTATASSGLSVTYSSSNPAALSVDPATGKLTAISSGVNIIITATQAGNDMYNEASITRSFNVISKMEATVITSLSASGTNELRIGGSSVTIGCVTNIAEENFTVVGDDGVVTTKFEDNILTITPMKTGEVTITLTKVEDDSYYAINQTYHIKVLGASALLTPDEAPALKYNEYAEITLSRTFTEGHSTLALPFDTNISDFSDDSEAYAAQLSLVTYNNLDGYTLYFKKVADGQMQANQPYVVCLPSTKKSFTWTDVKINSVTPLDKEEGQGERFQGWTMRANYTPELSMTDKFGIAEGVFRKGGAKSTINAYTAYFIPPTHSHATQNVRARVAVMDEGGNTTYIGELKDGVLQTEEGIYGLDGVQQNQLRKGINIVRQKDGSVRKILK